VQNRPRFFNTSLPSHGVALVLLLSSHGQGRVALALTVQPYLLVTDSASLISGEEIMRPQVLTALPLRG
jgi:hypothetical protein